MGGKVANCWTLKSPQPITRWILRARVNAKGIPAKSANPKPRAFVVRTKELPKITDNSP